MLKLEIVYLLCMEVVQEIGKQANKVAKFSKFFLKSKNFSNRFKSYDVCMGFCKAAIDQFEPSPNNQANLNVQEKSPSSFVTEPPLGPRPDLLEDDQSDTNGEDAETPVFEEYDESKCEVRFQFSRI